MSYKTGLAAIILLLSGYANAQDLTVTAPWMPAAPAGAGPVGAFMVLENHGDSKRVIVGASSLASDVVELHHTIEDAGVMHMVEQESFSVPAGGKLELAPGGYHIMLINPSVLAVGDVVDLTLHLKDGSSLLVETEVRASTPP